MMAKATIRSVLTMRLLHTLSGEIRDALCGFRLYPLEPTMELVKQSEPGKRMAFDPEILVRAVWAGIPLHFVDVKTIA